MGAILDAAIGSDGGRRPTVSDPFSGGGTVAIEAVRRGLPVYAQDIYPWPAMGLAVALTKVSLEEFDRSAKDLLTALEPLKAAFRRTDGKEITHIIRVRVGRCSKCRKKIYLFPSAMLSKASRSVKEKQTLYGCRACGKVHRGKDDRSPVCPSCKFDYRTIGNTKGFFACPHCEHESRISEFTGRKPVWKPVAVQELTMTNGRHRAAVRLPDSLDPLDSPPASESFRKLKKVIPDGIETRRLLEAGFRMWGDLYTARQANVILSALKWIHQSDASKACKDRLALAVLGAAEMPAYLCRWDRQYLKVYEGIANHRYAHTTLAVESNLLSILGRGTILRRLISARKALTWILEEAKENLNPAFLGWTSKRSNLDHGIFIAPGTSVRQHLKDSTIDLVLTDPPYFDDVQYGEMSRLLHLWLSLYKEIPKIDEQNEAVPNRTRGKEADFYVRTITKCLKESRRTLVTGGALILTFHNKKMVAWQSLCSSLYNAGFVVSAMAAVQAENDSDHTKRNGNGMLHDLVLECRKTKWSSGERAAVFGKKSAASRDLLCMGIAMDEAIRKGKPRDLPLLYYRELKRARISEGGIH